MNTHLIIPDPHAHPEYDNLRFRALGRYILDMRPTHIICLGDFADMPSLSLYDKGTRGFEGRRYKDDVAATVDAQNELFAAVTQYNKRRSANKKALYKPKLTMIGGNHDEARIEKATQASPELDGKLHMEDLRYETFGWQYVPFKETIVIDGIAYSHYFPSGLLGAPISGENIGGSLVRKLHMSCVQGHSHLYNHYEHTRPDGTKIFGLSAGCYSHKEYDENWCRNTKHMWWRGIVVLHGTDHWPGYYEKYEAITQAVLLRDYL